MAPRPISSSPTALAASGNWGPFSWTTISPAPNGLPWNTSGTDNRPHQPVHDPSGALWVVRAFRRHVDRAFCRGFSPLAGPASRPACMVVSQRSRTMAGRSRQAAGGGFPRFWRLSGGEIGSKIRDAQLELIPYMLVLGGRGGNGPGGPRDRLEGDKGACRWSGDCPAQGGGRSPTIRQVIKASAGLGGRQEVNDYRNWRNFAEKKQWRPSPLTRERACLILIVLDYGCRPVRMFPFLRTAEETWLSNLRSNTEDQRADSRFPRSRYWR